jgi:hypothetical protein
MKKLMVILVATSTLVSCSDDEPGVAPNVPSSVTLTAYENEVINYFHDVALGFEFGTASQVTRKWRTELKVFVGGYPNTTLLNELQTIVGEINVLATDGFKISITKDTLASNCYLLFDSGSKFASVYQPASSTVGTNFGLFYVFFDNENYIYRSLIYVDIFRANEIEQRHILREELTQSLGLARDSPKYFDSIFQASWTSTTSYSNIDRDLIRLLYHPYMQTGLNRQTSRGVLIQIIKALDI